MTAGQLAVLQALKEGPQTTRQVSNALRRNAHGILRRLEDKEFVRRIPVTSGRTYAEWELTHTGRQALETI